MSEAVTSEPDRGRNSRSGLFDWVCRRFSVTVSCPCIIVSLGIGICGCAQPVAENSLIVTQVPLGVPGAPSETALDKRYPPGSRVVLASGAGLRVVRVISEGLAAAGEPVMSHDGHRVVFTGKRGPGADWQVYEARPEHRGLKQLTFEKGGAKNPALLGDGTLIYVSPADVKRSGVSRSQLFAQRPGTKARQLTFSPVDVAEPTILADGRILFVAKDPNQSEDGTGLFTINNDGTELTAFCGQHEVHGFLHRPRELSGDRVVFLRSDARDESTGAAESVWTARPFTSREGLLSRTRAEVSCVQPTARGGWLVCARSEGSKGGKHTFSVFAASSAAPSLDHPLMGGDEWDNIEAIPAGAGLRPMGRLSTVDFTHRTGQLLCLNINQTTASEGGPPAKTVRILTSKSPSGDRVLGEVKVQADGSFMAEVPADVPIGFEAIDKAGKVLRRESPLIWVRPGENRACIGCHEAHNHSPRNVRPLAARVPVPRLGEDPEPLAKAAP